MIKVEKLEEGFRTYSDENYKIRPILDRLNQPIPENAVYDEAEDIEVDGSPRFDYEETDIKREIIKQNRRNYGKSKRNQSQRR